MSYWLRVGDPSGNPDIVDDIERVDPAKTHTGIGDFQFDVAPINLDSRAQTQDRIDLFFGTIGDASDSDLLFRGFLFDTEDNKTGNTTLEGEGIGKLLTEQEIADHLSGSQTTKTYSDIAAWKAVEDYWSLVEADLPFDVTVLEPPTSTIATDVDLQSADTTTEFQDITSLASNQPITISSGELQVQQSATLVTHDGGGYTGSQFTNGAATEFVQGDTETFAAGSVPYTIPAGDWELHIRSQDPDDEFGATDVVVDGNNLGNLTPLTNISWTTLSGSFDWSGGGVELDDSQDSLNTGISCAIDTMVVEDTRYSHGGLDNTTDGNGQLSTPRLFAPYTVVFSSATSALSIETADLSVTMGTGSEPDKLQVSFDGGSTWKPSDGTEQDTTSISASPADPTRSVQGRVTLSYTSATRTNDSPTTGYQGDTIDVWDLNVDQSDLKVIDEITVEGGDIRNLQKLHDLAAMRFLIEHSESDPVPVLSFTANQNDSQVRRDIDFRELDRRTGVSGENYANTAVVVGDGDPGSRPRGVAEDSTAVTNDGRVIKAGDGAIQIDDITTDAGARFAAEAILDQAQEAGEIRGEFDIVAQDIPPGISVEVDLGNGTEWAPIEEVRFQGGTTAIGTLNFDSGSTDLEDDLAYLDRNATGI